jgi:hypothetical protein
MGLSPSRVQAVLGLPWHAILCGSPNIKTSLASAHLGTNQEDNLLRRPVNAANDRYTRISLRSSRGAFASGSGSVSTVRSIAVVAKLAKSFGGATIPKISATFATTQSDPHFLNDA